MWKPMLSHFVVIVLLFLQFAHSQAIISCPVDIADATLRIGSYNSDGIAEYLVQQVTPNSSVTITSLTVQCRYGPDNSGAQPEPLFTTYGLSFAPFIAGALSNTSLGSTNCFIYFESSSVMNAPCVLTLDATLIAGQQYAIVINASATPSTNLVCAGSGQAGKRFGANCTGISLQDVDQYTRTDPRIAASFYTNDTGSHIVNILAFDTTFSVPDIQDPYITYFNGSVELFEGVHKTWYTLFEDEAAHVVVRGYIMKPEYPESWVKKETWLKQIFIQHLNCKVLVHINVRETASNCHEPEDLSAKLLFTKSAFYVVEVGRHYMPKRVNGEAVYEHYLDVFIKPQKAKSVKCIGLMC